ncbi:MAG: hypothetical protein K2P68_09790 [Sphingomonas sp.]|nr:hypothetical protein [Sphingomonas sp.]
MRTPWLMLSLPLLALPIPAIGQTAQTQPDSVERAATQPLRDAKIQKDKIPEVLQLAVSAPYSIDNMRTCRAIAIEVGKLNEALGDDVDRPAKRRGESSEIAAAAARAAVGAFIPGLGLVKVLTGADKAERRVEAAVYAGSVRRGYLKGVGLMRGCKPPAAPLPAAVADKPELPTDDAGSADK